MRFLIAITITSLPLIAGCIASASESSGQNAPFRLTWETLLTMYGPLGVWVGWLLHCDSQKKKDEKARVEREETRRKECQAKEEEQRKELVALIRNNTEALTQVKETLLLTRVDDEKHRTAIYRLVEEVRDISVRIGAMGGGTRIIAREE